MRIQTNKQTKKAHTLRKSPGCHSSLERENAKRFVLKNGLMGHLWLNLSTVFLESRVVCIIMFHISMAPHSLYLLLSFWAYFQTIFQINFLFFMPLASTVPPRPSNARLMQTLSDFLKTLLFPPSHKVIFHKHELISPANLKMKDKSERPTRVWDPKE